LSSRVTDGQRDLAEPVDLRIGGAGERDPGRFADPAVRAVAARQVPGGHPAGAVRAAHVSGHRGVVLADPGHLVSAAYVGAEFAGVFVEQALESRLRQVHRPYRGICQV
jgi:hypothetical protein